MGGDPAGSPGGEPPPVGNPLAASTIPHQKPSPQATCITANVAGIRMRTAIGSVRPASCPAATQAVAYTAVPLMVSRRPRRVGARAIIAGMAATSAGAARWCARITPGLARATRIFPLPYRKYWRKSGISPSRTW